MRNPLSVRPWQHVLEPIGGYLKLCRKIIFWVDGFDEAWNFGPNDTDCKSVEWITNTLLELNDCKNSWEQDLNYNPHEAQLLKLDISKAKNRLRWMPKWDLDYSLKKIVQWHKTYLSK